MRRKCDECGARLQASIQHYLDNCVVYDDGAVHQGHAIAVVIGSPAHRDGTFDVKLYCENDHEQGSIEAIVDERP